MFDPLARINSQLAKPATHRVVTLYSGRPPHSLDVRSEGAAATQAAIMGRSVGRDAICSETGRTVRRLAVIVGEL